MAVTAPVLYPATNPLRSHALPVGDSHVLHVEEFGHDAGIPAVVLHGGPGSGSSPLLRRLLDPARFRIVCIDQRGAGRSQPQGLIEHNSTDDLIEDLRKVREHLGIARWLVVGGSWGATLAVAHAAAEPDAVAGLLLRASFLARREDIDWFFQGAAAQEPTAWARLASVAPATHRQSLLPWLAGVFKQGRTPEAARAALAWWHWEQALSGTTINQALPDPDDTLINMLVNRYRIQSHYLVNDCWLGKPTLLERTNALPRVPTLLLHAPDDRVCRPEGAQALHQALAHSTLRWIDGAGHDATHPAMMAAMIQALDHYAAHAAFAQTTP